MLSRQDKTGKILMTGIITAWFFALSGCRHPAVTVTTTPQHFKVVFPFQTDSKGILVSTCWGTTAAKHRLYLDNHSPTWANDSVIRGNASISKSNDFLYNTATADGKMIEGDVYECNSVSLGAVSFKNVAFYNISNKSNANRTDGAIGENIMSRGIWKIDFKQQVITLSSSLDSIENIAEARLIPAIFTDKAIEIKIRFSNNTKQIIELDLGYNGCIILPAKEYTAALGPYQKNLTVLKKFSTPGGSSTIRETMAYDSIRAGGRSFTTMISTNELVKEKLIGLCFFYQFDFIIIDYINKAVYLSRKTDPTLQR